MISTSEVYSATNNVTHDVVAIKKLRKGSDTMMMKIISESCESDRLMKCYDVLHEGNDYWVHPSILAHLHRS